MAQPQLLQVKLSRFDAQPWGFRLQGGVDYGTPLLVQKVNGGSLAENAGLIPGDAVIKINDVDVFNLRHKDAQDVMVRSGNNFVITIQRGGSTWRPHVTPTGHMPQPHHNSPYLQTVTKTSLAHQQQEVQHIGSGYNNSARPFANGGDGNVKSIVNKQYNTPVGIYSDESIAETLSAQAEVLAGGVLGVNFKKNEREYQADKSEVLKFLREEETGQSTPEPHNPANFYWTHSHAIGGNERRPPPQPQPHEKREEAATLQQNAPASKPAPTPTPAPAAVAPEAADPRVIMLPVCPALQGPDYKAEMDAATAALARGDDATRPLSASGHPACQLCGVGIVGVFVRIKEKNLHVECFKCATCGTSLKNQGYYNFNNKLYCDIHAKLAAMQNPPAGTEGYVPVPIRPHTKLSANTISSALSAHGYNGVGVSNGGSTPTPAPAPLEDSCDLPLPPPPSPTQLQQFENDSELYGSVQHNNSNSNSNSHINSNMHQNSHARTHSSLSSLSSSSNTSSMSPTPAYTSGTPDFGQQHNNPSTSSTLSLDRFTSPMHSRQASSSSSLGMGGERESCATAFPMPPPPPPPSMMMADAKSDTLYINTKNQNDLSNTRTLQQHAAAKQQNENDMNSYNKNAAPLAPQTKNVYNKFLKEYSNKLLTQNNNNNDTNSTVANVTTLTHNSNNNNNTSDSKLFNDTAKPFTHSAHTPAPPSTLAPSQSIATTAASTTTSHVADVAAALANQLKFNPCQVANPTATSTIDNCSNIASNNNLNNSDVSSSNMSTALASEQLNYGQINSGNANTAQPSASTGDQPFEYVTLTGNVIRSVVPPGKGGNLNYKINQGYARPFGASGPPAASPKSPISYPPQPQQWNAPQQKPAGNPYATLPRTPVGPQGRHVQTYSDYHKNYSNNYSTQYRKPTVRPTKYATLPTYYSSNNYNNYNTNNYNRDACEGLQPQYAEECYEECRPAGSEYFEVDPEVEEANRQTRPNFAWPPPKDDSHVTPTAAPLYIAPPETQHVVAKPLQHPPPPPPVAQQQQDSLHEQSLAPAPQQTQSYWQSRSAPQLGCNNGLQAPEIGSSSDSYTSTSTTTTTTSEEYQRMYAAQVQAYQLQQGYDQSGSELDYTVDMEVASQDQYCLSSSDYISGRRSAQECVDSLAAPLNTYKLIDMVREVTPSPVRQLNTQAPRHVAFVDEPEVKELQCSAHETATEADAEFQIAASAEHAAELQQKNERNREVEQSDSEEAAKDELIIEDRSNILESQRIFQPTPEIKIDIPPVRQIPPTKIPNPMPKEWINPMVRVLTTAPEVPFHLAECPCPKPCDSKCEAEPDQELARQPQPHVTRQPFERPPSLEPTVEPEILRESPAAGSYLTNAMSTAPDYSMFFAPAAPETVPLPEETKPYMPPPIDMKPYMREDFRPKSPFLSALTTAPEKPFESHFDRDVPIHLLDLPTPKEHLTMSDALRTASDRAYTPLNPENATHKFDSEQKEKEKKKYEFQVLDREKELGITAVDCELGEAVEYYTTEKRSEQRKSSAFAAMQAFQPSREPLLPGTGTGASSNPRHSISSLSTGESNLEYEKYYKAQERNQKRLDYFHKKEEELQQQTHHQEHTQTNTRQASSLSSCTKASSSSNSSSTVQQMSNNTTTTYASNSTQASRSIQSAASANTASYQTSMKFDAHEVIAETVDELEHSEVLFPPPSPLSHLRGKPVQSGLHKADTIPKYQRNWTVLPTQSPVRTPEPQELRENVPLAFVDAPKTPSAVVSSASNPVHRPVAQMSTQVTSATSSQHQTTAAARGSITSTTSASSNQQRASEQRQQQSCWTASPQPQHTKPPVPPIIIEDRCGPVTMAFQSLDEHLQPDQSQTPSRPYTPSALNKPAPIIPFYQTPEKLCFDECPATHARAYDRRSASPFPDRARSPAPGPPPNPLANIRAPRMKEAEPAPVSARVLQAGSITTGQSYLGAQQAQLLSHTETKSQSGMQSYSKQPETVEQQTVGNLNIEKRQRESRLEEQKQSQQQSQTTTQIGNTQIERRRKVTEELEHTQSAKTVEIRTGTQATSTERRQSYGKNGYVAHQARRLSGLEQEITNLTSQSQAISARAANLTVESETFPRSPDPQANFPLKPVLPPHDEPTAPSYVLSASANSKMVGPPPGFQQQQLPSARAASLASSQQQQQQQQQKSLAEHSSTTTTTTSSSSQANAVSCNLTKASATNNQACAASAASAHARGICPATGTSCRPGYTCCQQQQLQPQTANNNNSNVSNNAYRPNASAGISGNKPPQASAAAAATTAAAAATSAAAAATTVAAPPPPAAAPSVSDNTNVGGSSGAGGKAGGVFGVTSAPKRGRGIINKAVGTGGRVPLCNSCHIQISATLPRQPKYAASATNPSQAETGAGQAAADLQADNDATAMLTESIGKINMGNKMNNFMAEAGKIISNMLESRLATGGQTSSNSGSSLSLLSNSSSNLSKSPMVVRKRFELEDFKDIDPTEPVSLKPVVATPPQKQLTLGGMNAAPPQLPKGVSSLTANMPTHHPMGKLLDMCDNKRTRPSDAPKPLGSAPQTLPPPPPPLPSSAVPQLKQQPLAQAETQLPAPMETVVFRNKKDDAARRLSRGGEMSTHAMDRRSYIEPQASAPTDAPTDAPAYSISVKAMLGGPVADANAPMSPENEQVVSQLLKDGKRPVCCQCNNEITKGPFITALGRIWCPEHFICVNANCRRPLQDIGFVEEKGDLYCEYCFEKYLAPSCSRCGGKIKGDCLNAIGKHFHPECFNCAQCGKHFGNTPFFLEDGNAYCEADWNELFTTKCYACGFPVEAGDRWVEALNHNYHSQCFNCTYCKQNLEGQSFYNKGGRPFCKNHAR